MKYVNTHMDCRVADMDIGSLWAGKGLSARTLNSVCACCGATLKEHAVVRCVYAASKGATGHKTLMGAECKPTVPESAKNAPTLELKVGYKGDADDAMGAIIWATQNQVREFSPARTTDGKKIAGEGILKIYITGSCSGIGKLGKSLSMAGFETKQQRMTRNGECTGWQPIDTATWAPFLGCGFYHGEKKYGI